MEAAFVRKLSKGYRGDARLYRLDAPVVSPDSGSIGRDSLFDHIVVSAADVPYSGPETYVFAANKDGDVVDWLELPGSFRGGFDHQRAVDGFIAAGGRWVDHE